MYKQEMNDYQHHGSSSWSVPMYPPIVDMIYTEQYRAIPSVPTHGTWGYTDVPPVLVSYRTNTYHPYRAIHHGMTNLDQHSNKKFIITRGRKQLYRMMKKRVVANTKCLLMHKKEPSHE